MGQDFNEVKGCKYTWSNHRKISSDLIMEGLDRLLANEKLVTLIPKASVIHLPKTHSDHHPILLELIPKISEPMPKPFRLENYWSGHPEFGKIGQSCWLNNQFTEASNTFKVCIIN